MPDKPPRACADPTCSSTVTEPGPFCPAHSHKAEQPAVRKMYDKQRPYRHLYQSAQWRTRTRPYILARDPVCVECNRNPSTVADHIKDHRGDIKLFYSLDNLRGVCKPCHDKKTGAEHGIGDRTPKVPYLIDGKVHDAGCVLTAPEPACAPVNAQELLKRHKAIAERS